MPTASRSRRSSSALHLTGLLRFILLSDAPPSCPPLLPSSSRNIISAAAPMCCGENGTYFGSSRGGRRPSLAAGAAPAPAAAAAAPALSRCRFESSPAFFLPSPSGRPSPLKAVLLRGSLDRMPPPATLMGAGVDDKPVWRAPMWAVRPDLAAPLGGCRVWAQRQAKGIRTHTTQNRACLVCN